MRLRNVAEKEEALIKNSTPSNKQILPINTAELHVKIANVNIVNPGLLPISRCSASIRTLVKDKEEIGTLDLLVHLLVYEKFLRDIYK